MSVTRKKTERKRRNRRAGRIIGVILISLVLLLMFYAVLLMAEPADRSGGTETTPLPASASMHADSEAELSALIRSMPVPVLGFLSGAGPSFVSASAYDTAFDGGFARVADLRFTAGDEEILARTICPASAVRLIGREGWELTGLTLRMAGLDAVRMDGSRRIRLHAVTDDAVYVLEVPMLGQDTLHALLQTSQLFTAGE